MTDPKEYEDEFRDARITLRDMDKTVNELLDIVVELNRENSRLERLLEVKNDKR